MCVFFLHVLCYVRLCLSSPLFYVSRRSPAEQKKKLNQISINMFHLYVPTLVSHTQTLNSLCVNLASSGLLSLEADCQHQCVRGESYLGLTSAAPIPRMRTVVFACVCVCVYRTGGLHSCSSDWPADALRRPPISFFFPRMESALRCDGMMLLSLLLFPLRGEPSTK